MSKRVTKKEMTALDEFSEAVLKMTTKPENPKEADFYFSFDLEKVYVWIDGEWIEGAMKDIPSIDNP